MWRSTHGVSFTCPLDLHGRSQPALTNAKPQTVATIAPRPQNKLAPPPTCKGAYSAPKTNSRPPRAQRCLLAPPTWKGAYSPPPHKAATRRQGVAKGVLTGVCAGYVLPTSPGRPRIQTNTSNPSLFLFCFRAGTPAFRHRPPHSAPAGMWPCLSSKTPPPARVRLSALFARTPAAATARARLLAQESRLVRCGVCCSGAVRRGVVRREGLRVFALEARRDEHHDE